jgi:hypothetical protein
VHLLHLPEAGFISVTEFTAGSSGFSLAFPQIKNTESNGSSRYQLFPVPLLLSKSNQAQFRKFASLD